MPLLNHTIKNISQGVSQQSDEERFETQVEEMINCNPDIALGTFRRNPIRVFDNNFALGARGPMVSIQDTPSGIHVYGNNGDWGYEPQVIAFWQGNFRYDSAYTTDEYQTGSNPVSSGKDVKNLDAAGANWDVANDDGYLLNGTEYDKLKFITLKSTTLVLNPNVPVATTKVDPTYTYNLYESVAFYWVKDTTQLLVSTTTSGDVTTNDYNGYEYKITLGGTTVSTQASSATGIMTPEEIAADLAAKLTAATTYIIVQHGPFIAMVRSSLLPVTDFSYSDSNSNRASVGWVKQIDDSSRLPSYLPSDLVNDVKTQLSTTKQPVVYITGGSNDDIGYWLEAEQENTVSDGLWVESCDPTSKEYLDPSTLPHILYIDDSYQPYYGQCTSANLTTLGLDMKGLDELGRLYGDTTTAKTPSIVGHTIKSMSYIQSRLVLVSESSFVMSEAGREFSFYPQSVRAALETDTIDISPSTTINNTLINIVEMDRAVLLFGTTAQFQIGTTDTAMSPSNVSLTIVSNYYIKDVEPRVFGSSIIFTSERNTYYSDIYAYRLSNKITKKYTADRLNLQAPNYITGFNKIITNYNARKILLPTIYDAYVCEFVDEKETTIQTALHKWEYPQGFDVLDIWSLESSIYILGKYNNTCYVYLQNLVADPTLDPEQYSYHRQQDEPEKAYLFDFINYDLTKLVDYTSSIKFSKFEVKDNDSIGTVVGETILKTLELTFKDSSKYQVEIDNTDMYDILPDTPFKDGVWHDGRYVNPVYTDYVWDDTQYWRDDGAVVSIKYIDTNYIPLNSRIDNTSITFKNNEDQPYTTFRLNTLNYEVFFYQRSQRY